MYGIGSALDTAPKYKTNTELMIENRQKIGLPPFSQEELKKMIDCEFIDAERKRLKRKYLYE